MFGLIEWALKEEAEGKKTKKDDAAEQVWQGRTGSCSNVSFLVYLT